MKLAKKRERAKIPPKQNPLFNDFIPDAELDFHNFGIIDHFQVEMILNNFIEDSYIANHKRIVVITGNGKVVKPLTKKLLRKNSYVKEFKEANYFNGKSGAFEVKLI
ncbi:MAG: hypothetical protein Kow0081_1860 [Candidatus Dojkabacteria bacterium]